MKKTVEKIIISGGIGVLPTDTLYGIVGSALKKRSVEKIYRLRKRNLKKPMIILIGSQAQLKIFGIRLDKNTEKILKKVWPGKVSIILPCRSKKWSYLHRGTKNLAFRLPAEVLTKAGLPKNKLLRKLLQKTGPLVTPSANIEGKPPAKTIKEAKKYFGNKVDFYMNVGRLESKPSTLVKIQKGKLWVLREGAVKV